MGLLSGVLKDKLLPKALGLTKDYVWFIEFYKSNRVNFVFTKRPGSDRYTFSDGQNTAFLANKPLHSYELGRDVYLVKEGHPENIDPHAAKGDQAFYQVISKAFDSVFQNCLDFELKERLLEHSSKDEKAAKVLKAATIAAVFLVVVFAIAAYFQWQTAGALTDLLERATDAGLTLKNVIQ